MSKNNLVLVHGYLGGSAQWAEQVEQFSADFNVIAIDLPGFGQKNDIDAPDTISGFAESVLDRLDRQKIDRFHLLGHSMGGMIVQEMVTLAPRRIEKLILYGTGPVGVMPGRFETLDESRQKVKQFGVEKIGPQIASTWFLHGTEAPGYPLCATLAQKASLQAALAGLDAMQTWSGVSRLKDILSPTLVLWGDGDRAYQWQQPEQLWREIKDAQLAVIPACSHAVHLEKPHLFNAVLKDFLHDL